MKPNLYISAINMYHDEYRVIDWLERSQFKGTFVECMIFKKERL